MYEVEKFSNNNLIFIDEKISIYYKKGNLFIKLNNEIKLPFSIKLIKNKPYNFLCK